MNQANPVQAETPVDIDYRELDRIVDEEFRQIIKDRVLEKLADSFLEDKQFKEYLDRVEKGDINPYLACEEILTGKGVWDALFSKLSTPPDEEAGP